MSSSSAMGFGNLGRGSDAVKHSLLMSLAGLFWTASAGFALFSVIWSVLWFGLNPPEIRDAGWNYTRASVVAYFKPTSPLKLTVGGVKRTVPASTLLQILNSSPALHHQVAIAKATATGFAVVAAIPALIVTVVMSMFFSFVGEFMQEDEHLRGVKIVDDRDEFNKIIARNIAGVRRVERGWVKRLRQFR